MANPAAQAFSLSYEISPLILEGGIAANATGGALPIISLLQPSGFGAGLLEPGGPITIDNALAVFSPIPGSTLISQQIGLYPFANQATAANAVITEPLSISFKMMSPARNPGDYGGYIQQILTAFAASIAQHNLLGGTYTAVTPAFIWSNCVMTGMRDISGNESKQVQFAWQLDFMKPLVTLSDAQAAQSSLMNKIGSGANVPGQPATSGSTTDPSSVQSPVAQPASQPLQGSQVQGPPPIAANSPANPNAGGPLGYLPYYGD